MKMLVPPQPPALVGLGDEGGSRRLRMRLHQVTLTAITVFATAYCVTLGWAPAIIALSVAKHILVAIFVAGLEVDATQADV